jgi:hypothetical protein
MKMYFFIIFTFVFSIVFIYSQSSEINYNDYYRFPISIGVEYQALSPFSDYAANYNIFDIAAKVRWTLPPLPSLQLLLNVGMMSFDNQDQIEPLKWDHTHWYGQLGAAYAHRFDKNFEISGELAAGASLAVFQDLLPDEGPISTTNLIFEVGARIGLDPSYNFSIDVHPSLKYLLSLSDLKDFDGFIFGIGFSASYRFGTDPDAPSAIIRSLEFSEIEVPDLFAAMQSYYVENSFASINITNPEKYDLENLEISFFQAGFMDTPTPVASYPVIKSSETINVPLTASFNRDVFDIEGITPLTGEIIAKYTSRGKPAEQRASITYDLYDKTSMIWDDDRKVASFITPSDSAIRNYASFIRQSCRESSVPAYSEPMQFAIQAFHALGEIGCLYQVDPTIPFTEVQENKMVVDSISLPRSTLKNITGDCDDLTVLYCSILESVGIDTAFITVPGHIYAAYNTKTPAREFAKIHPDRNMTIIIDGELWVPVEITMIGKSGFSEAWRTGMDQWNRYESETENRAMYKTRESQQLYRPVGLTQTDLGLQYGSPETINRNFKSEMDRIISYVVEEYSVKAKETGRKQDYNRLGIIYAQFNQYNKALSAFQKVLSIDPNFLSARINMGSLQFLQENYTGARNSFLSVFQKMEEQGKENTSTALKVLINLARANYLLEQFDQAEEYFTKAKNIDFEKTEMYSYLASSGGSDSGRASEEPLLRESILFLEDE